MPEKLKMFPLLIDRWVGGTQYMTLEEKGMYMDLLLYLFTEQRPIKDHKHVARICGIDPRRSARLWTKIGPKFELNQHGSTHVLVTKLLNNSGRIKGLDAGAYGGGVPAQEKEQEKKSFIDTPKPPKTEQTKFVVPESVDSTAWTEFEEHRKIIKKPLSDLARTKASNILIKLSPEDQRATVDKSIQSGWPGLFPDKVNGHEITQRPHQAFPESRSARADRIWRERNSREAVQGDGDQLRGDIQGGTGLGAESGNVGKILDGEFKRERS